MSIETLDRIKNLMVASCQCIHEGHRDIASNMMEIALDEIATLSPEDVDIGLALVKTVEDSSAENAFENEVFEDAGEIASDQEAHADLHGIVSRMVGKK